MASRASRAVVACVVAVALGGCSPQWSLPLAALDRVPLSVALLTPNEVYAVGGALDSGANALFLHYDGVVWHQLPVASDATLWWVFVLSPSSVYAAGERGLMLRFDGSGITTLTPPTTSTLFGVWGASDHDLWLVGGVPDVSGVILRFDGTTFTDMTPANASGAFFKVWGSSANDVFICGQNSAILHWDGSALVAQTTPLARPTSLFTVAGRASNDVYVVGGLASAVALHWDGAAWKSVSDPALAAAPGLSGVAVDFDGSVVFVGAQGTKLRGRPGNLVDDSAQATRADLHAASVRDGEIFTVGGNYEIPAPAPRQGVIAHFGGLVASTVR
jgi:photosystem II stability/assembly factor-like uncharacterized protein